MAGPTLLPGPFPSNSFTLGQLVTDLLNPSSSFLSVSTPLAERATSTQSPYKDVISHDDQGRFISSFAERPLSSYEDYLTIQADESEYRSIKNVAEAFNSIRQDTDARKWLRKMALGKQPLYYVSGIQQVRNPIFKRAVVQAGQVTEAPSSTDPKLRLPLHVRRDSAMDVQEDETDAVLAVEVRKVVCQVGRAEEPHSLEDIGFAWSYHDLGEELQLSIGLGKVVDAVDMRSLAGILGTDDDEMSDNSWDSGSDDEGLAGF